MKRNQYSAKKIYQEYINEKIPKNWELHHIDINPSNNEIYNLIALPKQVHREYHKILSKIVSSCGFDCCNLAHPKVSLEMENLIGISFDSALFVASEELVPFLKSEVQRYFALKNYLSDRLRNIGKAKMAYSGIPYFTPVLKEAYPELYKEYKQIDEWS